VTAAVLVRLVGDLVGRGNGVLDGLRRVLRRDGGAAVGRQPGLRAVAACRIAGARAAVAAALVVGRGLVVAARGGLQDARIAGRQPAVGAQVLAALEALDARRGRVPVDAVHDRPDARAGQVLLRDLDVASAVADLEGAATEARIRRARKHQNREAGAHGEAARGTAHRSRSHSDCPLFVSASGVS
jgi:hypothetical protein